MGFFSGPKTVFPDTNKLSANAVNQTVSNLPALLAALQGGQAGQAQLQTDIAKQQSPQLANLMMQLYGDYAPKLNEIGNSLIAQNIQSQADIAGGPGKALMEQLLSNAKIMDPEFFNTRELTSSRLGDLMKSINLDSGLSGSERSEIERGLNQESLRRGTTFAPSQQETVSNAMQYGQAGRQRELENRDSLAQAISAATSFLPASRTGFDTNTMSTGSNQRNTGLDYFTGIQDSGGGKEAFGLGQGLANSTFGLAAQQAAPYKKEAGLGYQFGQSFLNSLGEGLGGSMGSTVGTGAGGAILKCWVAREVYGIDNPRWLEFRHWLTTEAPVWFDNLYTNYGERFAKFISNKPIMKKIIRTIFDKILGK